MALELRASVRVHAGRGVKVGVDLLRKDGTKFGVHKPFAFGGDGARGRGCCLRPAGASAVGRGRTGRRGLGDLGGASDDLRVRAHNVYAVWCNVYDVVCYDIIAYIG